MKLSSLKVWLTLEYLHFGQKMICLGIFGLKFEKAIVIFEVNALKFVWLQSLVQNKNP